MIKWFFNYVRVMILHRDEGLFLIPMICKFLNFDTSACMLSGVPTRKSSMQNKEDKAPKIPKEIQRYISNAKRHHYVPEFLLRRFSTNPTEEHPLICQLNIKAATISKLSTINCAVIHQ